MTESAYGLVVEGVYDEAVYPELICRILASDIRVRVRPTGGVSQLMKKFPGLLRDLEHAAQEKPVDKALVIRDWRGPDIRTIEQQMAEKVQGKRFHFPHAVQFCAVRQEMETWLLADVEAINAVASGRGGRVVLAVTDDLERIGNPKERFKKLLSAAGLPYDQEVCRQIACKCSLDRLRSRCPSFRSFETKVIDC